MSDRATEYERVTQRLLRDVVATVGDAHRRLVLRRAAEVRSLALLEPSEKLVEDVQQQLHDERVDTIWPRCPRHGDHPLWYRSGTWRCDRDGHVVAALGMLPVPS